MEITIKNSNVILYNNLHYILENLTKKNLYQFFQGFIYNDEEINFWNRPITAIWLCENDATQDKHFYT